MARPTTRPDPNKADPLSEATAGRRIWAGYLARGWTRADFARRMGVRYQTVDRWDTDQQVPGLDMLERAAELLGFTVHELVHGRAIGREGSARTSTTPELAPMLFSDELSADDREALARLLQEYLTEIAHTFLASYHAERAAGVDPARAFKKARDVAHDARALAAKTRALSEAVALGGHAAIDFAKGSRTKTR